MKNLLMVFLFMFSYQLYSQHNIPNLKNKIVPLFRHDKLEVKKTQHFGMDINFEIKPQHPVYGEEFEILLTFVSQKDIDSMLIRISCPTKYINFINEKSKILIWEKKSLKNGEKYTKKIVAKMVKKYTDGDIYRRRIHRDIITIQIYNTIKNEKYEEHKKLYIYRKNVVNIDFETFNKKYLERMQEKENNRSQYNNGEIKIDSTKALPLENNNNINDNKKAYHLWGYCKVLDSQDKLIPFKKGAVVLYDAQDDSYIRHVYTDDNGYYYIVTSNNSSDYVQAKISNGIFEGINSKIQLAKSRARGYQNTQNLINMVYFIADKLKFDYPRYST